MKQPQSKSANHLIIFSVHTLHLQTACMKVQVINARYSAVTTSPFPLIWLLLDSNSPLQRRSLCRKFSCVALLKRMRMLDVMLAIQQGQGAMKHRFWSFVWEEALIYNAHPMHECPAGIFSFRQAASMSFIS